MISCVDTGTHGIGDAHTSVDEWLRPQWDRAALLVVDTQVDFVDGASPIPGTAEVLPALAQLVAAFRGAGRPVVHVVRLYDGEDVDLVRRTLIASGASIVRPGSPGSQLAGALRPAGAPDLVAADLLAGGFQPLADQEWAMWKPRWGAFHRTDLDAFLRGRGVSTVVVAGCNFPNCPRATVYGASERDYRVVIAADSVSGVQAWHLQEAGRIGALPYRAGDIAAALRRG